MTCPSEMSWGKIHFRFILKLFYSNNSLLSEGSISLVLLLYIVVST
jgi:hypothetical protein